MFEPILESWSWIRSLFPVDGKWERPRLNFITVHYLYILAMTIIGSIMLYPAGLMAYIDALFFAAGMATQSGLNTINVNDLNTYQQVVMMLLTCFCTPVFINTVVVFVRLYWFEKRFEHVVKEIRSQRQSRARSFRSFLSRSRARDEDDDVDPNRVERGVNGRPIVVLHETTVPNGMSGPTARTDQERKEFAEKHGMEALAPSSQVVEKDSPESSGSGSGSGSASDGVSLPDRSNATTESTAADDESHGPSLDGSSESRPPARPDNWLSNREITFADLPSPATRLQQESAEEHKDMSRHIQFLQRQQNDAKKGGALRIPGPRDFDRGVLPQQLDDMEMLHRPQTHNSNEVSANRVSEDQRPESRQVQRAITINEPVHPARERASEEHAPLATTTSRLERWRSNILRRKNSGRSLGLDGSRSVSRTFNSFTTARTELEDQPYLSFQATTGRNSMFFGLTEQQREELGGIEYRSLKTLAGVLLGYYFGFHLLGVVVLLPWIVTTQPCKSYVQSVGQNPVWWGIFTPASMFNDLGFTLTPDSMISFEYAVLPLLIGSFLIVIGNTGFPCMLRFMIWILSHLAPVGSGVWEELRFLLDHPRRCFTLLFPSKATWWLFWVLILLNGTDLLFFVVLDLNNTPVSSLRGGFKVLNGWFQAVSTRTAGFACVNLAELHPAVQVSYLIMMYISVFPIAISVRRTNVYEEKSLGIFGGEEEVDDNGEQSYLGQHLRRQLSFDLWYIFLGFFIIAIAEGDRIQDVNEPAFTMFAVLFEIVSAYGTVGLSLGYPNIDMSFSAEFNTISKLVIIAMMIRGRHRGLPYALDRAILLPSEKLQQREAEENDRRYQLQRRPSMARREFEQGELELDEYGLPTQHLGHLHPGDGPDHPAPPPRRMSTVSTASRASGRAAKRKSLARFIAGGLSAGPTLPKHD